MQVTSKAVATVADRMKNAERQRFEAGEKPGHSLCACGHVIRTEWMAFHLSESPLHR